LVKRTTNAVVQIVASDDTGGQSLGSGFFVSQDGKIVSNFHVIEGTNSAIVKLANGSSLPVKGILAEDANKDLVILKVDGRKLEFLNLDSTFELQVGDHVVAIGSPLGFEGTVSDGIVSAVRSDEKDKTWIQTTAPVSHGNSGGPLLNMHGNVVGVIARGMNPGEGQNLNFAIPALEVVRLLSLSSDLSISPLGNECTNIAKTVDNVVERPGEVYDDLWVEILEQARQGDAVAQRRLSDRSDTEAYFAKDNIASAYLKKAAYWSCRRAVRGDAASQFRLGAILREIFLNGYGDMWDNSKAAYWFGESAKQGYVAAQLELGEINTDSRNFAEAYFWLSIGTATTEAESRKDIQSLRKKRDEAAAHLSTAQLAQVQERVRKWSEEGHTPKSLVH
jgi:hypothetical protein